MYIYLRKVNIYAKKMQVFPFMYYNIYICIFVYVYYYFVDILYYYIIMLHDINIIHTCKQYYFFILHNACARKDVKIFYFSRL